MVKASKARGNKRHEGPQHTNQEAPDMDSPNLSSIEKASFLGSVGENYGNPLHSTALEADSNPPADGGMDGAEEGGGADQGTRDQGTKEKKSTGKKVVDGGVSRVTEQGKTDGKKRKMKRKHVRISSGADTLESGFSSPPKQRQRGAVSSSDENAGPKSSSKKSRNRKSSSDGSGNRKSSSDGRNPRKQRRTMTKSTSVSTDSGSPNVDQQTEKGRGKATELEVVLDAFLAFCHQYRESVESQAVRKAIDAFSSSVKEELAKKITIAKELRVLMRENAKVDVLIRKKRQRLLDVKDELMSTEHQVESMRKEEAKLVQRLADIKRGHTFLSGMSELTKQYLDHRSAHPQEKEEYGASSLPALLLETKNILGAESQLRQINNQLEERLKETGE